jgi:hypothetical protein
MTPRQPSFYLANCGLGDPIFSSNGSLRSSIRQNQPDLIFGQYGKVLPFSSNIIGRSGEFSSTFVDHVVHVVGCGSDEQMTWVDAAGHVAAVAHKQSVRNWANEYFVCDSMSAPRNIVNASYAVSCWIGVPHPNPASRLSDSFNSFLEKLWRWLVAWPTHDTSTKAVEVSRVSAVVAARRLQPFVPACEG